MSMLVRPDGGAELQPWLLVGGARAAEQRRAATLPKPSANSRGRGDIRLRGRSGFTLLAGFMPHAELRDVCNGMRLANGLLAPIPITLSAEPAAAAQFSRPDALGILRACCRGRKTPDLPDHADATPTLHPNHHRPGDRPCPAM